MARVASVEIEIDKVAIARLIEYQRQLLGESGKPMSFRDLAEKMGVKSHSTIVSAMTPDDPSIPDMKFFYGLARIAGMKLSEVLAIAFPGMEDAEISPRALAIARVVDRLDERSIDVAENFIVSTASKVRKQAQ